MYLCYDCVGKKSGQTWLIGVAIGFFNLCTAIEQENSMPKYLQIKYANEFK